MSHQHLKFETEPGAGRAKWIAGLLVLIIAGWMASGYVLPSQDEEAELVPLDQRIEPVAVAVKLSEARPVAEIFIAEGQAEADRIVQIRAEAGGTIERVVLRKGDEVEAGQLIASIDPAQRAADLARAEAEESRALREFENSETLLERGVATTDRLAQARSALAAARAALANAEQAIGNLDIVAPIAGRIEDLQIAEGEFIDAGASVGEVVDLTPLIIKMQIPQQSIGDLKLGQQAQVTFTNGQKVLGEVSFLGSAADAQTRTFRGEVSIPNEGGAIPAGLSAQVYVPTGESEAHFLSPAILSLDNDGTLGVKAVGENNVVTFYPITIVRAQTDGIWVDGLPDQLEVITIGQGFVNSGETVNPQPAETLQQKLREVEPPVEEVAPEVSE